MKTYGALFAVVSVAVTFAGCISPKYKLAPKGTPPVVPLNVVAAQPPVELVLNAVIIYKGPGSWKREALWDEYVVTIRNQSEGPLTITAATLVDFAGVSLQPGADPWALEKESQTLEQRYKKAGVAFARNALPGVLILGTGTAALIAIGPFAAGASLAAAAVTVVALPVYYIVVLSVNHSNKSAVKAEFARRRLALPVALGPGETRTGSLFFPMVPNPQSLNAQWVAGPTGGEVQLSLEFLRGLHVPSRAPAAPTIPPSSPTGINPIAQTLEFYNRITYSAVRRPGIRFLYGNHEYAVSGAPQLPPVIVSLGSTPA